MAEKHTKPLFTVRFTLANTRFYSAAEIVKIFEPELKKAGFVVYQTPAVKGYTAKYTLSKEGPWEGDDSKAVYESMTIQGPDGKDQLITKDIVNDPQGSAPILEKRTPKISAFAWNLGPPAGATPQSLIDLIWQIERTKLYDKAKMLGFGWTPIAATWEATPVKKAPYPDRPAIPSVLIPPKPKPKPKPKQPKPKPKPKPDPKPIVPPAPPAPTPEPSLFSNWRLWLGLGIAGAWVYFGRDD